MGVSFHVTKPATSSSLIPAILLVVLLGLAIVLQLQFSACTCTRSVPTLIYSPCQLCWLMRKQTKYSWPSVNRILSIFTPKSLISSLNLFYSLKQLKTARKSLQVIAKWDTLTHLTLISVKPCSIDPKPPERIWSNKEYASRGLIPKNYNSFICCSRYTILQNMKKIQQYDRLVKKKHQRRGLNKMMQPQPNY